jgi:hypothetical protein
MSNHDDIDDEEEENNYGVIHLGFINEGNSLSNLLFRNSNWNDWDGGKVGGKPVMDIKKQPIRLPLN